MKISPFLLDKNNHAAIDGKSVAMRVLEQDKKHLWDERGPAIVDTAVIHFASAHDVNKRRAFDMKLVVKIFCDLGVSCHYMIDRKGKIFSLVPEDKKAWHCGGSIMPLPDNRRGVNVFSIGIELIATRDSGFTEKQYASLVSLCSNMEKRHKRELIYVGHEHIAGKRAVKLGLRKDIKVDPGNNFNWNKFLCALRTPPKRRLESKHHQTMPAAFENSGIVAHSKNH